MQSASSVSSRRLQNKWPRVCRVERARAQQYLEGRTQASFGVLPLPSNVTGASKDMKLMMAALQALLAARGTLCNDLRPCSVKAGTVLGHHLESGFHVCLGDVSNITGESPIMCEAVPTVESPTTFFVKKGCSRGLEGRCFAFDRKGIESRFHKLRANANGWRAAPHGAAPVAWPKGRWCVARQKGESAQHPTDYNQLLTLLSTSERIVPRACAMAAAPSCSQATRFGVQPTRGGRSSTAVTTTLCSAQIG